jgi:allantoinase
MKPRPYGPFAYSPITLRPKLTWPNGARVALWVIPNLEFFSLTESAFGTKIVKAPGIPDWSVRDFGNRIGVFRLMEVLDRYSIRATVALNSDLCLHHPEIIAAGQARRWEWMGHNETNTTRLNAVPPDEERPLIARTVATIESATGTKPRGWLSSGLQETWNSLDALAAEGIDYVCDWVNDEQPYPMQLEGGARMTAIPYSNEINDKAAYDNFHFTPDEFRNMITREFDVLYRDGEKSARVMAIALHPYLSGRAHRIDALDAALRHICSHEHVWLATGSEIVDAFTSVAPAASS